MYIALESFATKDYDVRRNQLLEDDFASQDEIDEFLAIKYIEVYSPPTPSFSFPIGSIYLSVEQTNPSEYFGGTWQQIKDTFLLAAGDTYTAGSTGGEASHTLTMEEIPKHDMWLSSGGYSPELETAINAGGTYGLATLNKSPTEAHNNMPPYLTVYVWKRTA